MKRYGLLAVILVAALVFPTLVGAQGGDTLPGSGWWTGQQIQNVGTAAATIVSTAYDANSGATYLASSGSVPAGGSVTFLPADFSGMPNGFQGSAVVASDQPIKAIVNLTNRRVGSYGVDGGVAGGQYQGVDGSAAATNLRFPIVKYQYGGSPNIKSTTLFVQNAGSAATTVHAVYTCGSGNYTYDSPSMNPGQMVVLNASAAGVPPGQLCSGTVTSAQAIAGVATEHYATETIATLVQATRGFTPADFSATIYAPAYKKKYPNHPTLGRTTGAQVQNVGSAAVTITGTFYGSTSGSSTCGGQTYTVTSPSIAPGASYTFLNPTGMPDGCLASAKFTVASGSIVGIVNESYLTPAPNPGYQSATAYNMASSASATAKVVAPLFKEKFGNKTSGLQVQNIGTAAATVHVVFASGTNTWTTVNVSIPAGASYSYFLVSDCGAACWGTGTPMPPGTNASVQVFSDQPTLGVISESTWYSTLPNCFGQTDPTKPCYDKANYEGFNVAP